jgi:hypothetical protein
MDIIKRVEREEHDPPHESSFGPKAQQIREPNGSAGHQQTEPTEPAQPPIRARTNSSLEPRSARFFRWNSNPPQIVESHSPGRKEKEGSPQTDEGYLPCHYFDYIAGTSTGG